MKNAAKRREVENNLNPLSEMQIFDYQRRLSKTYFKIKEKSFLDQFLRGGGSELENKFWSPNSSSRLCFDVYSWIANEDKCINVELEYKLPRIEKLGQPNMDVYIETDDEVWYIESKFTEHVNNSKFEKDMPEAYWKEVDDEHNSCKGGGFFNTSKKYCNTPIWARYGGDNELQKQFQHFCDETNSQSQLIDKKDLWDWFDAKQESCHVLGVIAEINRRKSDPEYLKKAIRLANIVFYFDEEQSEFSKNFIERATALVKSLTGVENFRYDVFTIQDVVKQYGDKMAYESDKTVRQQIRDSFGPIMD